jgi:hypothetical protein
VIAVQPLVPPSENVATLTISVRQKPEETKSKTHTNPIDARQPWTMTAVQQQAIKQSH